MSLMTVDGEAIETTLPGRTLDLALQGGRSRAQLAADLADENNRAGLGYSALSEVRAGRPGVPHVYVLDDEAPPVARAPGEPTSRNESIFRPLAQGVASFGNFAIEHQGQAEFGVFAISALSGGPIRTTLSYAADGVLGGEIDRFESTFRTAFATSLAAGGLDVPSSYFIASGATSVGSIILRGSPRSGVNRAIDTADLLRLLSTAVSTINTTQSLSQAQAAEHTWLGGYNAVRAREIVSVLSRREQNGMTVAVLAADRNGEVVTYVAGGMTHNLTRAQRDMLGPGEIPVMGRTDVHAEIKVLDMALSEGARPLALGVSRSFCPNCPPTISAAPYNGAIIPDRVAIWPQNLIPVH